MADAPPSPPADWGDLPRRWPPRRSGRKPLKPKWRRAASTATELERQAGVTVRKPLRVPARVAAANADGAAAGDSEGPEETDCFEVDGEGKVRLDALLGDRYGQSRSYFEMLLDRGAVLVNGERRKKAFRGLSDGDIVEVRFLLDERTMPLKPEDIPLDIIHEDEDLLVVNKPAGLVVHPAPGHWNGTLVNAVLNHVGGSSASLSDAPPGPDSQLRPGIVHRLDVGTSGAMAVTKTNAAFKKLSKSFADREVQKTYLAAVAGSREAFRGHFPGGGYSIAHPIGRSSLDRRKMAVVAERGGGRSATTLARALAEGRDTSLLELRPRTGRTHQIRVHLAEEHTPVLGDTAYGVPGFNRRYAGLAQRPLLHAHRLAFEHPRTGQPCEFEAPLPDDLLALVRRMEPLKGEEALVDSLLKSR